MRAGAQARSGTRDGLPYHVILLEKLRQRAEEFDVIHFHIDLFQMPLVRILEGRTVTTLHGRLDLPDLQPFYRMFSDVPLVSISDAQRRPPANRAGTVHHGLPLDLLPFREQPGGGYLAFLGRISPEKRPDRAIEIAARTGWPLRIAAKIDAVDRAYRETTIRPMVALHPDVAFIGEISEREKAAFLGGAAALLFPIDWPESFGLVMIEAMACGTPVIAFRGGSVPEIVEDSASGFVVDSLDDAVAAVGYLGELGRLRIREIFEQRFSAERMARDYVAIYQILHDISPALHLASAPREVPDRQLLA